MSRDPRSSDAFRSTAFSILDSLRNSLGATVGDLERLQAGLSYIFWKSCMFSHVLRTCFVFPRNRSDLSVWWLASPPLDPGTLSSPTRTLTEETSAREDECFKRYSSLQLLCNLLGQVRFPHQRCRIRPPLSTHTHIYIYTYIYTYERSAGMIVFRN